MNRAGNVNRRRVGTTRKIAASATNKPQAEQPNDQAPREEVARCE